MRALRRPYPGGRRLLGADTAAWILRRGQALRLGPAVVVVQPDDVVFAEVVAVLDLDEHQRHGTGVVDPVRGAGRHVHGVAPLDLGELAVQGHDPGTADHEPVFRPPGVPLVAEALPGVDLDRLDLVIPGFGEDGVSPPWALSMISHPAILPDQPVMRDRYGGPGARRPTQSRRQNGSA